VAWLNLLKGGVLAAIDEIATEPQLPQAPRKNGGPQTCLLNAGQLVETAELERLALKEN